ncbi:MAG: glycosyltransferase [Pseudomonadota bacterium]|nr:glycosyltransferase [Pseudomonadota bacterium]
MNRVCAVIVTHNPDPRFIENVELIATQVNQIIIVDNGSHEAGRRLVQIVERLEKVKVAYNPENLGIAAGLNIGFKNAIKGGFDWVLTLDQDSRPGAKMVESLFDVYDKCQNQKQIGLLSAVAIEERIPTEISKVPCVNSNGLYHDTEVVMSSGSLVKTSVFLEVGGFDESLFIYYVDHDYCFRILAAGYRIFQTPLATFYHNTGLISRHKFLHRHFFTNNYSEKKRYYITRNRLVLYRKYLLARPKWVFDDMVRFAKEFIKILVAEDNKVEKIYSIGKGITHSLQNRLGSYGHSNELH